MSYTLVKALATRINHDCEVKYNSFNEPFISLANDNVAITYDVISHYFHVWNREAEMWHSKYILDIANYINTIDIRIYE